MLDALRRMKPKQPFSDLADRIANDLGGFNAVHIRRGDFKKTSGVTTLDRTPSEAIDAMDQHFSRNDRLVLLTDEANDPFFDEVKATYPNHIFLDDHILDNYGSEFSDLSAHDSIALAFIAQLVASHSQDFIGTMTSTFTALIQRMRGNRGRNEPFKFLWNELPPPGVKLEPGRHEIGHDVPLEKGIMVEQNDGPYSWNRFNSRINMSWMREWPEAFLDEPAMLERTARRQYKFNSPQLNEIARSNQDAGRGSVSFLGRSATISSDNAGILGAMKNLFEMMSGDVGAPSLGDVRIQLEPSPARLLVNDEFTAKAGGGAQLLRKAYREVVRLFIEDTPDLVWFHASSVGKDGHVIVLPGTWGRGKSSLALELYKQGWTFLSDDIVPMDPGSGCAIPFPGTPQLRTGTHNALSRNQLSALSKKAFPLDRERVAEGPLPVRLIVFPYFEPHVEPTLIPNSPAPAVGELLENCLSFPKNNDETIQKLCNRVESLPVCSLRYGNIQEGAQALTNLFDDAANRPLNTLVG